MRDEDFSDFDDDLVTQSSDDPDDPDYDGPGICPSCNGSGEGMHEGKRCAMCRGHGEF